MKSHYFDNNATTRLYPEALEAMRLGFEEAYANASSVHDHGTRASYLVEKSRAEIAEILSVAPEQLIFTSGGTEADNLAVHAAVASKRVGPSIFSRIEHPAVKEPAAYWGEKYGREAIWLQAQKDGRVKLADFDRPAGLMALMLANNESGAIQPVAEVAKLAAKYGAWMHCDAVQAAGKIPVNLTELGVDSAAFSAHKFHGPKGIGVLYLKEPKSCPPLMRGGSQEGGVRPGTINVQGIAGMASALKVSVSKMAKEGERLNGLKRLLQSELTKHGVEFIVNGTQELCLPNTINLRIVGRDAKEAVRLMSDRGFAVSAGAACASSGRVIASAVLVAMGNEESHAKESLRVTMGIDNDEAAILGLAKAFAEIAPKKA